MIYILIYLVGYVLSYLLQRFYIRDNWTVRERTIALILSLGSWLIFGYTLILFLKVEVKKMLNNHNKAKW